MVLQDFKNGESTQELPVWPTWSSQKKILPQDFHQEEVCAATVKTLHRDPDSYFALELAILGI